MINDEVVQEIRTLVQGFWDEGVTRPDFIAMAAGKEIGHRIADAVDERTTNFLQGRYETRFEIGAGGKKRSRSMGDVWLKANNIFHPINVKTGEYGSNGQPNMTAMGKLLQALLTCQIDAYYLLIIKLRLPKVGINGIIPNVYFVDMLDYLDAMTFDSGPGQIMMREGQFYELLNSNETPIQLSLMQKVGKLFSMLEDGERRLIKNRERRLKKLEQLYTIYGNSFEHNVTQSNLKLQP